MLRAICASILLGLAFSAGAQTAAQQVPQKELRAPDVIFVPTPHEVVDAMLKVAKVGKGDVLYDLGSGDGRIPITAAQKYGIARGVGIDINPERIKEANESLAKAGVGDRVLVLDEGNGTTIRFALEGRQYEIDLSSANAQRLRAALAPFISAGRSVTGARGSSGTRRSSRNASGELAAIPGSVPALGALPVGCPFAPRCPDRFEPCAIATPALTDQGPRREVRCYLHSPTAEPGAVPAGITRTRSVD